jgi:hypothetical protein
MIVPWEDCVTPTGFCYRRSVRPDVPRVPDTYVNSVVYIYKSVADAERSRRGGGCGVLVGVPCEQIPEVGHVYVVTNAHVAETCRVVRYNTQQGVRIHDLSAVRWYDHPDGWDVSVCPLLLTFFFDDKVAVLRDSLFLTRERMEGIPLRHGDELFMVSRYGDHPGDDSNEPIVRFGTLAKSRPVIVKRPDGDKEAFLAEMRSLPGHSGSPAFVFFYGMAARLGADEPDKLPKPATHLLGIDSFHPAQKRWMKESMPDGKDRVVGTHYVEENSGIAGIVPAWRIAEILDRDELKEDRRKTEEAMMEEPPQDDVILDTETDGGEFDRFRDLTRNLLNVSKTEISED